jgi:hypothetical protein
MRFKREVVHPAIFAASDRIMQRVWTTGGFQGSPEQMQAFADHQAVWYKEYGWGIVFFILAALASFGGLVGVKELMGGGPGFVALVMALITFWTVASVVGYRKNLRSLTSRELKALAPAMDLTPIQRVYADALVALAELKMPEEQFQEVVGQLNRLLDEETRLLALRDRGTGTPASQAEIQKEHARISDRLAATEDSITAEALQRSLEICENRLKAAQELSFVPERVEAQLEMVDQAIRGIRDSLLRLHSTPAMTAPTIDMDALRHTVDTAHRHSVALEQAVEEVRTIA